MKRKRILTVLIVLALVFIWGNSLVSRGELSGKISDDILFFLNAAAEKVGLGPGRFHLYDGRGRRRRCRAADEPSHPQGGARHGVCGVCSASVPPAGEYREKAVFYRLGSRHADRRDRRNASDILPPRQSGAGRAHRHRRRAAGSSHCVIDLLHEKAEREKSNRLLFFYAPVQVFKRVGKPAELVDESASDGFLAVEHAADVLRSARRCASYTR